MGARASETKYVSKVNFIITKQNVKFISDTNLMLRYKKLKRQLSKMSIIDHPDIVLELKSEFDFIKSVLIDRNLDHVLEEQLSIPGLLPKKDEYFDLVVSLLRSHAVNKLRLESLRYELQRGFEIVFPNNISSIYHNDSGIHGNSEFISKSEKAVIEAENRREKTEKEIEDLESQIFHVEKALEQLSTLERDLVYCKYIHYRQEKQDTWIMERMAVGRTKFYELQNSAIATLAEALGLLGGTDEFFQI